MPHCFTPDAFYTGKNVCSRNLFYQRASHHKTFSRRLIGLQTATLDTTQTTSTYPSAAILNSYLQQPIFSKFFKAAILSSYLQQSSCYCWVGGHLATFGVGGHLATVRISGHLATAGGCGHLATVVVGGHLAKFGLWVSYLISFCCCQGWWSAIPHHKNPFRLVVFEEKKNESGFLSSNFSVACKTSSNSLRHRSSTGPRAPEPHRLSSFMTEWLVGHLSAPTQEISLQDVSTFLPAVFVRWENPGAFGNNFGKNTPTIEHSFLPLIPRPRSSAPLHRCDELNRPFPASP